jgi:hypothetical protein
MKKKTIIQIGVVLVVLLAVAFIPSKKEVTTPLSPAWQIYKNIGNNFLLRYPSQASAQEGSPRGLYLEPDTDNATTLVSVVSPRVDTFSENGSHGYFEFQVRVMASPVAKFACARDADIDPTVTTGGDAGMGNRVSWTRYDFCHGGKLYWVYDIFASGSDGTPLTPKLEADVAAGKEQNKKIAESFRFVDFSNPELE